MSKGKEKNKSIKQTGEKEIEDIVTEKEIENILTKCVKEEIRIGEDDIEGVRKKLIELAAAGKIQEVSKEYTIKYFEKAKKADLLFANSIYDHHVVKRMQKSIGSCLVAAYSNFIGKYIDIDDNDSLSKDLNDDPFLEQALDNLSLSLYGKCGYLFAPASVALITSKHCRYINGEGNKGRSQQNGEESSEKNK